MATVKPFRGIVYNQKKIKDVAAVVSPAYDIIPPGMQAALYRRDPRNVIRLELGKTRTGDSVRDNRYTRARSCFEAWLKKGIMVRDEKPALYIYSQGYIDNGRRIERVGFLALMGFGEDGGQEVLPHENTLKAPKEDRLNLMLQVKANLSPIFVLFDDKTRRVTPLLKKLMATRRPFISLTWDGERHRVWRVDDPAPVGIVMAAMRKAPLFIADGHHRFETAKNFARELARRGASPAEIDRAKSLMVYFVESDERMLTVLPAHRLPKDIGDLGEKTIVEKLSRSFYVERVPSFRAMMKRLGALAATHAFGMYFGRSRAYILRLKDVRDSDRAIKDKPKDWKRLDVAILHLFVFQHVLGIRDTDDNVEFVKDAAETALLVDRKRFPVAFFLNPTKASQVKRIARLGERMPRKATYFYPKPLTGLVINTLAS